jgi:hypothetical protein
MITVLVAVFMFASRIKIDLGEILRPTDWFLIFVFLRKTSFENYAAFGLSNVKSP